jgi:hypothetical protein
MTIGRIAPIAENNCIYFSTSQIKQNNPFHYRKGCREKSFTDFGF